ncbi:hypothetical protein NDU88_006868 [Pleurodeles waltl]|uniref:Uncharacterized protein n=1 Tax=Pleurodeles waltl TaxID=8319 RepID=A0AAV7NRF1_PLEWA|nr:hypothetical protein NDU88_006868 [Pleurodeles waltl]
MESGPTGAPLPLLPELRSSSALLGSLTVAAASGPQVSGLSRGFPRGPLLKRPVRVRLAGGNGESPPSDYCFKRPFPLGSSLPSRRTCPRPRHCKEDWCHTGTVLRGSSAHLLIWGLGVCTSGEPYGSKQCTPPAAQPL